MNLHTVSIVPTESVVSWPTAHAECLLPGCGWTCDGRSTTVIALSMDHNDGR